MNILDHVQCPSCGNALFLEVFSAQGTVVEKGLLSCRTCGERMGINERFVLNAWTRANQQRLDALNREFGCGARLPEAGADFAFFVEVVRRTADRSLRNAARQVLNLLYYLAAFFAVCIYAVLRKKGKRSGPDLSRVIDKLAESYYAVPEMALWKFMEIRAIRTHFPMKNLGVLLDIGGANGQITGILLEGADTRGRINADIFGWPSDYHDFVLSEDIRHSAVRRRSIDTVMSICVLEHVPDADRLLHSIADMIKPGGCFLFTTPKSDYYRAIVPWVLLDAFRWRRMRDAYRRFEIEHTYHRSVHEDRTWMGALLAAGFTDIKRFDFFSREGFFLVDLINLSAKLPTTFHFWHWFPNRVSRHPWLRRALTAALRGLLTRVDRFESTGKEHFTHSLYIARKKGQNVGSPSSDVDMSEDPAQVG